MDGLHVIFLLSFIATLIAAGISTLKGKPPQWSHEELEISQEAKSEMEPIAITDDFSF